MVSNSMAFFWAFSAMDSFTDAHQGLLHGIADEQKDGRKQQRYDGQRPAIRPIMTMNSSANGASMSVASVAEVKKSRKLSKSRMLES